jgi:hypothetical protein
VAALLDDKPYYDVRDIMCMLGLESEEYVRRLGRKGTIPGRLPGLKQHRYLKDEVQRWIWSGHIFSSAVPRPVGPLQEEAYRRCREGDHSWMFEERFEGHAYTVESSAEIKGHMMYPLMKRTCYYCHHVETGQTLP